MYAQDYDELFAAPSLMPNGWLPDLHAPYLRQWKVFVCPSDPKAQVWDGVWASQTFFRRTSYIWNAYIFQGDPADYRRSLPMAAIPSPATVVLWLDGYANAGWVTDAVPPSVPDRGYAYIHTAYGDSLNASKRDPSAAPCRVHNGEHLNTKHAEGGNYAFVDGHAKWFMPGAFTTEALLRSRGAIMNDRTDPFVTNGARQAAISTICPVFCCPRDIGTPPGDGNHPWFRP
jgi:prepilin-type processing-associated H-X9-DG protein